MELKIGTVVKSTEKLTKGLTGVILGKIHGDSGFLVRFDDVKTDEARRRHALHNARGYQFDDGTDAKQPEANVRWLYPDALEIIDGPQNFEIWN